MASSSTSTLMLASSISTSPLSSVISMGPTLSSKSPKVDFLFSQIVEILSPLISLPR